MIFCFFFSSRRRHTSSYGDWSSDVCSSDLLSAHDFARAAGTPLFWLVIAGIVVALVYGRRIGAWFGGAPLAAAGLLGACAAVAVGVLVNDSGGSYLAIGGI